MSFIPSHPESGDLQAAPTTVQQAVRARALADIEAERSRPTVPISRRILIVVLTLAAVTGFVVSVNFGVTSMYTIMEIWYPGSISGRVAAPPKPIDPSQPFFITVEPESAQSSSMSMQSADAAAK